MIAVYFGVYGSWPRAKGETVRCLVLAVSKEQARLVRNYCLAILESRPAFQRLITATDADSISLSTGVTIQVVSNSYRSIRGPSVALAVFEEVAFWYSENTTNPDKEVLRAVRPSMLTMPGALLIGISSPYARRGLLWEKYKKHYGRDGKVLVWKADTKTMNPAVDPDIIADAYVDDPIAAAAEYGAEFRSDIESYVTLEVVEALISHGVFERPPIGGVRYHAFCDPSGGGNDSMTLAIAHMHKDLATLDCVREIKPKFSPEIVVAEFAAILKSYRVSKVIGDRYAAEWVVDAFKKHSITYVHSEKSKSEIYVELLPILNSGKADLLDHKVMLNQLVGLERRVSRGGRDSIDHPPGGHDDLANAVAGVITNLRGKIGSYDTTLDWVSNRSDENNWNHKAKMAYVASGGRLNSNFRFGRGW
jgi:hypothetical protein